MSFRKAAALEMGYVKEEAVVEQNGWSENDGGRIFEESCRYNW
jgi:hypothetical protein